MHSIIGKGNVLILQKQHMNTNKIILYPSLLASFYFQGVTCLKSILKFTLLYNIILFEIINTMAAEPISHVIKPLL